MKKITKVILFGLSLIGVATSLNVQAAAINLISKLRPVTVNIDNNAHVPLYNARIKLHASNTWDDLGNVKEGENTFMAYSFTDDRPGIFEAQLAHGQWLVAPYDKDHTGIISLKIEASQDDQFKKMLATEYKADISALYLYSVDTHQSGLLPVSVENIDYEWSISCSGIAIPPETNIACAIDSDPAIAYNGTGWGNTIGYMKGTFHTTIPAELLPKVYGKQDSTTYTIGNLILYSKLKVEPEHDYATFWGITGAGGSHGSGQYRAISTTH